MGGQENPQEPIDEKISANLWEDKLCITDGTVTLPQERVQDGIAGYTLPIEISLQPLPKLSSKVKPGSDLETSKTRLISHAFSLLLPPLNNEQQ